MAIRQVAPARASAGRPHGEKGEATKEQQATRERGITGGDWADCLSAVEIDKLLGSTAVIPADTFWRWKAGELTTTAIHNMLWKKKKNAKEGEALRFIIWLRHHWICAELSSRPHEWNELLIFDSAASIAVKKDIEKTGSPTPHVGKRLCEPLVYVCVVL